LDGRGSPLCFWPSVRLSLEPCFGRRDAMMTTCRLSSCIYHFSKQHAPCCSTANGKLFSALSVKPPEKYVTFSTTVLLAKLRLRTSWPLHSSVRGHRGGVGGIKFTQILLRISKPRQGKQHLFPLTWLSSSDRNSAICCQHFGHLYTVKILL
jgi:hypothetical protein